MNQHNAPDNGFVNVASYLIRSARVQPQKPAVVCPAGRDPNGRVRYIHLTFQQLDQKSDILAHGLERVGINRGSRTILMVKPGLDFFGIIFALFKIGAVPVVVDPGMGLRRMLSCLAESEPEAFIGISAAHALRTLQPKYFKTVKTWVTVGRRWFWGGHTLEQLGAASQGPYSPARTGRDETAAILFTTGSTGPAKGAVYTHGNFDAQLNQIKTHLGLSADEIDLSTFPLFALFWPAQGITSVIPDMDPTRPALANPEKIIESINDWKVTQMFASPALLNRVGRYGRKNNIKLPSLKRVISAGAPVSADVIERFAALLPEESEIHTPYGATEAVPIISIRSREILTQTRKLSEQGFGTCIGYPINDTIVSLIRISDDPIANWSDELVVPDNEIGEITVKGGLVTRRYFNRPDADVLSKIKDGDGFRHRMGDLGRRDKQGRIWFYGRKNHRVITPGETLFTIPCEAIFNLHPQVFRSALVGVGSAPNQRPVICIELEDTARRKDRRRIRKELLALAKSNEKTLKIDAVLFCKAFPVDIRHNSKIFREKLAIWAAKQIG
ncbi:MAG: fatty acid CoA ligase family protein [Desulfobacterales bacterium]|nr:fatty acid CoA ligase family protein [Desulfobacterales bacterium]